MGKKRFFVSSALRKEILQTNSSSLEEEMALDKVFRIAGFREVVFPEDNRLPLDKIRGRQAIVLPWDEFRLAASNDYLERQEANKKKETVAILGVPEKQQPKFLPRIGKTTRDGGRVAWLKKRAARQLRDKEIRIDRKGKGGEQGNKNQGKRGGKNRKK